MPAGERKAVRSSTPKTESCCVTGGLESLAKIAHSALVSIQSKPSNASGASAFEKRLEILMVLLARNVEQSILISEPSQRVASVQLLFEDLLRVWEGLSAAEAAQAAEDARLFRTKVKETIFQSEEVSQHS